METQAAFNYAPEHGPSVALKFGHESIVPINSAQGLGSLHPVVPVHTQVVFHAAQVESVLANVLEAQALGIQTVEAVASATLSQRPSVPPVNV